MTQLVLSRALLSVSDKTGLVDFARGLSTLGIELISTGGTAEALRRDGLPVRDVSELTGFPEILDGRVKTLHPLVHGGILARRDVESHLTQLQEHHIAPIDLVIVNLYPFVTTIRKEGVTVKEAIENIDVGGPTMIRAAAKNFRDVVVVTSPNDYQTVLEEIQNLGGVSPATRLHLARQAFAHTARYDQAIADFLANRVDLEPASEALSVVAAPLFPPRLTLQFDRRQAMRYGENPHQEAALYVSHDEADQAGIATAEQIQGKELSFNNLVDLEAAWRLVGEFRSPTCAIIKHTNPCGVGQAASPLEALQRALATDPVSAFGGIYAFNVPLDAATATELAGIFIEAVIAPDYDEASLEIFAKKKNVRVMRTPGVSMAGQSTFAVKSLSGGILVQTEDTLHVSSDMLRTVTERAPSEKEIRDLLFAWTVCKHVKSNAIVYARDGQTVGIGAGQMSRVDSVKIGAMKAQVPLPGCVLASDAFFPFRDGVDEAARNQVTAIIQPGGSVRDEEVIIAANEHGMAMVVTGVRHFKH